MNSHHSMSLSPLKRVWSRSNRASRIGTQGVVRRVVLMHRVSIHRDTRAAPRSSGYALAIVAGVGWRVSIPALVYRRVCRGPSSAFQDRFTMAGNTVRFHRVLKAPPERIYRAFLDADALAKWLPPNGFTGKVHAL